MKRIVKCYQTRPLAEWHFWRLDAAGPVPRAAAALRSHGAVGGDGTSMIRVGVASWILSDYTEAQLSRPNRDEVRLSAASVVLKAGLMEAAAAALWAHLSSLPTAEQAISCACSIIQQCSCIVVGVFSSPEDWCVGLAAQPKKLQRAQQAGMNCYSPLSPQMRPC